MMSYERVRRRIDPALTDQKLDELVAKNRMFLRPAVLKQGKRGVAKQIP
jgi:hypothetical protein